MSFSKLLIQWYLQNKRDLPWRKTQNPYPIWLSEIMLQQTRVAQGLPYYESFLKNFPTVFDLANAPEQQVLLLWQGLGYYSRARNLHQTAQIVANQYNGVFPADYKGLLSLKGIGSYTAAAIASFAYNHDVAVLDGNVFRVLSRYFDIDQDIMLPTTKKYFENLATSLLPKNDAATFNQAIMEFGALQCVPKNPDCSNCIFATSCLAFKLKKVGLLPVKLKKIKITKRFFNYLILKDDCQKTMIKQRTDKGIWHNLYEFPLIESQTEIEIDTLENQLAATDIFENKIQKISQLSPISVLHKLTHQHLYIKFWEIKVAGNLDDGFLHTELKQFPFPIVIHNFIEKHYFLADK